jgi:hypothetical protein
VIQNNLNSEVISKANRAENGYCFGNVGTFYTEKRCTYIEYHLLGYNTVEAGRSLSTFRRKYV